MPSQLWFNLPGIVAAYQPLYAPNASAARINISPGSGVKYKATDVAATGWNSAIGWICTGSTARFSTGVIPVLGWTIISRTSSVTSNGYAYTGDASNTSWLCRNNTGWSWQTTGSIYNSSVTPANNDVVTVAGVRCFINGVYVGDTPTGSGVSDGLILGNRAAGGRPLGNLLAFAAYNRTLSDTEVRFVSRQIRYCDTNPDWSAWSARRRYWFPSPEVAAAYGRQLLFAEQMRVMNE